MKRFIIGTANFGNIYGLSKKSVNKKEILKIIKEAKNLNIRFLDTANFYGKAEEILGKLNLKNFNFITKIKVTKNLIDNPNNIKKIISETIKNLKIKKIYAVLIHNPFFLNLKHIFDHNMDYNIKALKISQNQLFIYYQYLEIISEIRKKRDKN